MLCIFSEDKLSACYYLREMDCAVLVKGGAVSTCSEEGMLFLV